MNQKKPVIGIVLGDHAGIGPEIVAKAIKKGIDGYIPVIIGNYEIFRSILIQYALDISLTIVNEELAEGDISGTLTGSGNRGISIFDVPSDRKIQYGSISDASGKLQYLSILKGIRLAQQGKVDGLALAPLTKHSLHAAGLPYQSEFDIFSNEFQHMGIKGVVKAGSIFRCSVVGHVAFSQIINNLTMPAVVDTGLQLIEVMGRFGQSDRGIAVAALNPHAGEGGLLGDEEERILQPAIEQLRKTGVKVQGPCPADTVFLKAKSGEVGGLVYLYHDQGNIAMKSACFSEAVVIYTRTTFPMASVGHGSALDISGKGVADPANMCNCIDTVYEMINCSEKNNA